MDDYTNENLMESRNEWVSRLINILLPHLVEGINSIFKESYEMCITNNEHDKYLMTFQNFLSRIPSWNQTIIEQECQRIIANSKCNYINDLLTCVHVIMLKSLTNVRVCKNQKKIDIDIPKFEGFIHNVYIQIARKLYKNIYLYEQECTPLQKQKNCRECELIIRECILNTIRDTIPVDTILRAYMSENMEEEVDVEEPPTQPKTDISDNTMSSELENKQSHGESNENIQIVKETGQPAPATPAPAAPVPAAPVPAAPAPAAPVPAAPAPAAPVPAAPVPAAPAPPPVVPSARTNIESSENLLSEMNSIIESDSMEPIELDFDSLPDSNDGGPIRISGDNDENLLTLDDITEL